MARPNNYNTKVKPKLNTVMEMTPATNKQIAGFLGIGITSYYEYLNNHPEFLDAVKTAKDRTDDLIENALFNRAMGLPCLEVIEETVGRGDAKRALKRCVTRNLPPDVTAMIFWLKNRRPDKWRDKQNIEFDSPITIQLLPEEAQL